MIPTYQQTDNDRCFECNMRVPKWASVNNGILICLNCSGKHRGLGVNVSFVRSNDMDSWSERQLNMMQIGGNQRLKQFFESYSIPQEAPLEFKYKTKASIYHIYQNRVCKSEIYMIKPFRNRFTYYREMLAAQVDGKDVSDPPGFEEGLKLVNFSNPNFNQNNTPNIGFGNQKEEQKSDDSVEKVKGFFVSAFNKTADMANKVLKSKHKAYDKTVETSKKAQSSIKQKMNDPELKEDMNKFKNNVSKKTEELGSKAKEGAQKLKQGILGLWGQIQGKKEPQKQHQYEMQEDKNNYQEYFEQDDANQQQVNQNDQNQQKEEPKQIAKDDLLDFNDDKDYKN